MLSFLNILKKYLSRYVLKSEVTKPLVDLPVHLCLVLRETQSLKTFCYHIREHRLLLSKNTFRQIGLGCVSEIVCKLPLGKGLANRRLSSLANKNPIPWITFCVFAFLNNSHLDPLWYSSWYSDKSSLTLFALFCESLSDCLYYL